MPRLRTVGSRVRCVCGASSRLHFDSKLMVLANGLTCRGSGMGLDRFVSMWYSWPTAANLQFSFGDEGLVNMTKVAGLQSHTQI